MAGAYATDTRYNVRHAEVQHGGAVQVGHMGFRGVLRHMRPSGTHLVITAHLVRPAGLIHRGYYPL